MYPHWEEVVGDFDEILVSHGSDHEQYYHLGCNAMWSGRSLQTFWRNIVPLSSR
jgi:hypothetical protein